MDMLLSRFDELKLDSIYLDQLCSEAVALKKFQQAVPWICERVRISTTSSDIESCLDKAVEIVTSADQVDATLDRYKSKATRNTAETCFLIELLERSTRSAEADVLLTTSLAEVDSASEKESLQMLARQQVRLLIGRQDWQPAAEAALRLIDLPGGRKSVNVRQLVELYVRSDDQKSALKWIEEWKRLSPGSLLPWLNEASLLNRLGRYKDAIAVLRMATRQFPDDPDLFAQLAQKYIDSGQAAEANRIYWRQYDDSEQLSDKLRWAERLANVAENSGQVEGLIATLTERRKSNPQSIVPLLAIAQAHRIADNYEERRIALLEATRLQKDNLPLLLEIARMEEAEGDWEKAVETLERASLLDASNRAKQNIARIFIEYGEIKEGLARLLEIAGGASSSANDVEKIAIAILETGDWEQLREFMIPQVDRFADDYRLKFILAIANEELGFATEARKQFLGLVNRQTERPSFSSAKNPRASYFQQQMQRFRGTIPDGAIEFTNMASYAGEAAYSYLNERSRRGYNPFSGGGANSYLPNSVDDCRRFALVHLRNLATEATETELKSLKGELVRSGVADVDLLMSGIDQQTMREDPSAVFTQFPENENALALVILSSINSGMEDDEIALKGYETFKDSYPTLAFYAALNLNFDEDDNQTLFEKSLSEIEKLEQPNETIVMAVAQRITALESAADDASKGLGQYRERLNQLLSDWYPKLTQTQGVSEWVFAQLVQSLRSEESPQRFIEFLDNDLQQNKTQNQPSPMAMFYGGYRGGNEAAIMLPEFPPRSLPTFSPLVYGQLNLYEGGEDQGFFDPFSDGDQTPLTTAQVAEAVSVATNPILKALLQIKYFQSPAAERTAATQAMVGEGVEDTNAAMAQLLEAEKTSIPALYLAASFAASEKRWEDASAQFEKIRSLPMDVTTRRLIDGHLVALATQGVVKNFASKENEKVLLSAKSAALRMRRGSLSQEQRAGLVEVFESLGLTDEAEKMESRIASSGTSGGGGFSGFSMAAPASRVAELANSGKNDAAGRLLAQEFRTLARAELSFDSMLRNDYAVREFKSKLSEMDLKQEVLAQLDPADSTSARKLSTWAVATELLADKDQAKAIYEKLLESHPKEHEARLRLLALELDGDEDAFAKHFTQVNKRKQAEFMAALIRSFSGQDSNGPQVLGVAESVMNFVESNEVADEDLAWIPSLLNATTNRLPLLDYGYEYRTPSIYAKKTSEVPEAERTPSKQLQKKRDLLVQLAQRQRVLHDRIAKKMIEVPAVSAAGFTALLASETAAESEVNDQLVELALKSVYPAKVSRRNASSMGMSMSMSYGSRMYYGGDEETMVPMRTPVEFLARHYGMDDVDHSAQIETIASQLESLNAKEDAARLQGIYQLCRTENDQYLTVAAEQIEAAKTGSRRPDEQKWQATLGNVYEIWDERNLAADISDLVIEFASREQQNAGYFPGGENNVIGKYIGRLAKDPQQSAAEKFLQRLRTKMLGSEQEQQALAEMLSDPKQLARNRKKLAPVMSYLSTVGQLSEARETFFLAINETRRFQMPGQGGNSSYRLSELIDGFKSTESKELLSWLGKANLLSGVKDFDPFLQPDSSQEPTLWGSTLASLEYRMDGDLKKEVIRELETKQERLFGETVLLELCKDRSANIYDVLGQFADEFDALDEEQQVTLATFAKQLDNDPAQMGQRRPPATSPGKRISKVCTARMRKLVGASIDKLLAADRFRDLGIEEHELEEWSKGVLSAMDPTDTETVMAAISKISKWSSSNSQMGYSGFDDTSLRSQLVDSVLTRLDYGSFKLLLEVFENEDFTDFSLSDDIEERIAEFFKQELATAKGKLAKEKEKESASPEALTVAAIDGLQHQLGDTLGDRQMLSFLPVFQRLFAEMNGDEQQAIDKWFQLEVAGKHPKIGNSMRLAWLSVRGLLQRKAAISAADTEDEDSIEAVERFDKMQPYQAELITFIGDDSLSIQARLPTAVGLVTLDQQLPAAGVWASSELIEEAIRADARLTDAQLVRLFKAAMDCSSDEQFRQSAGSLAKAWTQAKIKGSRNYGYYSSSYQNPIVNAVRILAKSGNQADLRKLLALDRNSNDPTMLVALVESGMHSEARNRCRAYWAESSPASPFEAREAAYTRSLQEQLPELLKLFKDDAGKYFTELFFASLPNSKSNKDAVAETAEERLASLAKRFPSIEFRSKRQRQMTLIILSSVPEAAGAIGADLAELAKDLDPRELLKDGDSELQQQILAAHLSVQAELENYEPLLETWRRINGVSAGAAGETESELTAPEDNWQARNFIGSISKSVSTSFSRKMETATAQQVEEMLPLLNELNDPNFKYALNPGLNAIAHLITGRTDELIEAWNAARKESDDEEVSSSTDMDSFLVEVQKWAERSGAADDVARTKLVTDVWTIGAKCGFSVGSGHYQDGVQESCSGCSESNFGIEQIAELKLLTDEQILEIGPTLAELNSVDGEVWRQVAKRQFQAKQYQSAAESFEKALAATKDEMKQASENRRVEYANSLVKLGRNEEAAKLLDGVDVGQLFGDNPAKHAELKVLLKIE